MAIYLGRKLNSYLVSSHRQMNRTWNNCQLLTMILMTKRDSVF